MRLRNWFLLILIFIIGVFLIFSGMYLDTLYYHYLKKSIASAHAFREEFWYSGQLSIFGALILVFVIAVIFVYGLIWRRRWWYGESDGAESEDIGNKDGQMLPQHEEHCVACALAYRIRLATLIETGKHHALAGKADRFRLISTTVIN